MTTHLAGSLVTVDGARQRQLCEWCGYRLVDRDLRLIMVVDDGDPRPPASWAPGSLVRVEGHVAGLVEDAGEGGLPADSCARE